MAKANNYDFIETRAARRRCQSGILGSGPPLALRFRRSRPAQAPAASAARCGSRPMEDNRSSSLSFRQPALPKPLVPSDCASIGIIVAPYLTLIASAPPENYTTLTDVTASPTTATFPVILAGQLPHWLFRGLQCSLMLRLARPADPPGPFYRSASDHSSPPDSLRSLPARARVCRPDFQRRTMHLA